MTLEEAIRHAEEVVKEQEEASKRWNECKDRGTIGWSNSDLVSVEKSIENCDKCAAEHRQLAEWLKELKERRGRMDRLDDAISNVAYILDTLMAYRNIVDSGDCNRCGKKKACEYAPNAGRLVRYNCPFYKESGEGE